MGGGGASNHAHLKGAGNLIEVKATEKPSSGLRIRIFLTQVIKT